MDQTEQTNHFGDELDKLVDRFRKEYDISYASVIGTMQMKIYLLCSEAEERADEL